MAVNSRIFCLFLVMTVSLSVFWTVEAVERIPSSDKEHSTTTDSPSDPLIQVPVSPDETPKSESVETESDDGFPFPPGEKIVYIIKKMGVKAGESSLTFNGLVDFEGRKLYLITFTAKAPRFVDEEKIYADPVNLYPVVVLRNLDIWGKKEIIREEYLTHADIIKITKEARGKTTEQLIRKPGKVDNIYCFIYRYRRLSEIQKKEKAFLLALPTKDVVIEFVESTTVSIERKDYAANLLESNPRQYKIWFDPSAKSIPLRISGAVGFGDTAMTIMEYGNINRDSGEWPLVPLED